MARFKIDVNEWCSRTGKMAFKGTEYNLKLMEMEELKILDLEVKEDRALLEQLVRRDDLDDVGLNWREEVKATIAVRKRQLNAICVEFLRRKKDEQPLESFAFSAVFHLLGGEVLAQVKTKAREMQQEAKEKKAVRKAEIYAIPVVRDRMCGDKVRHPNEDSANEQLENMKAHGKNTKGMAIYGPCPFCGFFHVGHKPKGALWKPKAK